MMMGMKLVGWGTALGGMWVKNGHQGYCGWSFQRCMHLPNGYGETRIEVNKLNENRNTHDKKKIIESFRIELSNLTCWNCEISKSQLNIKIVPTIWLLNAWGDKTKVLIWTPRNSLSRALLYGTWWTGGQCMVVVEIPLIIRLHLVLRLLRYNCYCT